MALKRLDRLQHYGFSVPLQPISLAVIRSSVLTVAEPLGEEVAERLALIFNELLTNVIRHSGLGSHDLADISLELGDRVRGSVADRGRGFDPKTIPAPATSGEGGFGLTIVDGLTSKWGVRRGRSPDSPNEVWFEL